MDAVDATRVLPGRTRARLRRVLLGDGAPLSARAHAALLLAAVLLGASLSAAVFVGVWRDTATRSDRAQAAQAVTRTQVAQAQARLAAAEHALAQARGRVRAAEHRLAVLRRRDAGVSRALPQELAAAKAGATALGRSSATLTSALKALAGYLQTTAPAAIDPGFLAAQVDYLIRSSRSAAAASAALQSRLDAASRSAAPLGRG